MAELTTLSYRPGESLLHRMDPRIKLASMVLLSLACLRADFPALAVLTAVLAAAVAASGLPLAAQLREIKVFYLLLLAVLVVRGLTTSGRPLLTLCCIALTREGLMDGLHVCWRLWVVLLLGLAMTGSSRPVQIRAAVEWYLRPVPGIPHRRVGVMLGLVLRFIPLIMDQAIETRTALRARGLENRKNPFHRLRRFSLPLLRRIFQDAEALTLAMAARGYSDRRTRQPLKSRPSDWLVLGCVLGLAALCLRY